MGDPEASEEKQDLEKPVFKVINKGHTFRFYGVHESDMGKYVPIFEHLGKYVDNKKDSLKNIPGIMDDFDHLFGKLKKHNKDNPGDIELTLPILKAVLGDSDPGENDNFDKLRATICLVMQQELSTKMGAMAASASLALDGTEESIKFFVDYMENNLEMIGEQFQVVFGLGDELRKEHNNDNFEMFDKTFKLIGRASGTALEKSELSNEGVKNNLSPFVKLVDNISKNWGSD